MSSCASAHRWHVTSPHSALRDCWDVASNHHRLLFLQWAREAFCANRAHGKHHNLAKGNLQPVRTQGPHVRGWAPSLLVHSSQKHVSGLLGHCSKGRERDDRWPVPRAALGLQGRRHLNTVGRGPEWLHHPSLLSDRTAWQQGAGLGHEEVQGSGTEGRAWGWPRAPGAPTTWREAQGEQSGERRVTFLCRLNFT